MVRTASTMLPLGTLAPGFMLPDPDGVLVELGALAAGKVVCVAFLCNHCPYVVHVADGIARVADHALARGAAFVGICANDIETHPEDAPPHMKERARAWGWRFPYLFDATQEVARAYRAACTPDFFLFDREHRLVYRGQLDDARPHNDLPSTGADLKGAIDAAIDGRPVAEDQRASLGCNIKWKPGNEPEWFG